MTRFDAIRRQLGDIEKAHERALAKHDMQIRLLCGYRDELEDKLEIAVEMVAETCLCGTDVVAEEIDERYKAMHAARKVAVGA